MSGRGKKKSRLHKEEEEEEEIEEEEVVSKKGKKALKDTEEDRTSEITSYFQNSKGEEHDKLLSGITVNRGSQGTTLTFSRNKAQLRNVVHVRLQYFLLPLTFCSLFVEIKIIMEEQLLQKLNSKTFSMLSKL
jgi:hypothetical protein